MNKIELLMGVVDDLRNLAEKLRDFINMAVEEESGKGGQLETAASEPAPEPEPKRKKVTLEEVRAVLADKSHDGFTAEVRALLQKYGADKLSRIDPANYGALLKDAEELK